jgi:hypothetical protein
MNLHGCWAFRLQTIPATPATTNSSSLIPNVSATANIPITKARKQKQKKQPAAALDKQPSRWFFLPTGPSDHDVSPTSSSRTNPNFSIFNSPFAYSHVSLDMSERSNSPVDSSPYSEVPTEPLPPNDALQMQQYMTRRSHFLSDFEAYSPVRNMQMLAHHVFELSEGVGRLQVGVGRLNDDHTSSRRQFSIMAANQRDTSESIMGLAQDMEQVKGGVEGVRTELKGDIGGLRGEIDALRSEMHNIRQETQQNFAEIKQMLAMMVQVRG